MKDIDWLSFCIPCNNWCCKGESPFASEEELAVLKIDKICQKDGGSCMFLEDGRCSCYTDRPFECRIFPFDIIEGLCNFY